MPTKLRSQDTEGNTIWGTSFIIQGQGTTVAPGLPGEYVFRWRVAGKAAFGEPTARAT